MAADTYITNVVQYGHYNDTDTIYGVVRDTSKRARDVVNGAWDTYDDADLDDYDISAATASGGLWSGSFPVEATNGFYIYQFRIRAGGSAADGDELVFSLKGYWNGAKFVTGVDVVTVLGATPITLANIVAAIFAKTGITAGGTWTFAKILKISAAWAAGKWQDKSGSPGTYEVLDAENGTTKILEITPGEDSPQKQTTVS